jgi:lipopolysaccharide transport system ATP-binding protein
MYMRLAFSVAAHLEPEILLVDEVLAVGDATFQKKCLGKMGDVARSGRTVILVSHNMGAVEQLCQSAVLLEKGRVAAVGRNVRQIVQDYLNQGKSQSSDVEWLNSGRELESPWFTPVRFAVVDENGRAVSNPVRNDQPVWVEIRGTVDQVDSRLAVGYALSTSGGQLLYWSETTDGPESSWPRIEHGEWIFRSQLPQRLLNEGNYRLELIAVLHMQAYLLKPDENSPVIELAIEGGLSDSPYITVARDGILAPMLPWSYQAAGVAPQPVPSR